MTNPYPVSSRSKGFTLIEVLVTTSLFSVAMSVLLVGVFSGTRAWDRADRNIEKHALLRTALEQFREDVEHAQMGSIEELEAILDGEGRPIWKAPTLDTRPGSSWEGGILDVEWRIESQEGSLHWIRSSQPLMGTENLESQTVEVMANEIMGMTLEFRQEGRWVTVPDVEGEQPDQIRVVLTRNDGSAHAVIARLFQGVFDGNLGGSGRGGAEESGDPEDGNEEESEPQEGIGAIPGFPQAQGGLS